MWGKLMCDTSFYFTKNKSEEQTATIKHIGWNNNDKKKIFCKIELKESLRISEKKKLERPLDK